MEGDQDFEGRKVDYVWVKDRVGNEFLCPMESLMDPESATASQMENCYDDATFAGVEKS